MSETHDWKKALDQIPEPLPMQAEIWAAGADPDTARFVARMLREKGYYLVRPDDLDWSDIEVFQAELRKGQDIREDAGGFLLRCIRRLLRIPSVNDDPVVTHRQAAEAMLKAREAGHD